jgi:hypothetical protein
MRTRSVAVGLVTWVQTVYIYIYYVYTSTYKYSVFHMYFKKLRGLSPPANFTDPAIAACRRS